MKDLLNFLMILLLLVIITFFVKNKKKKVISESFISTKPNTNPNLNQDWLKQSKRFESYNQNYDKVWKSPYQSSKYPKVSSYPTSFVDLYKLNQYIFNTYPNNVVVFIAKILSNGFEDVQLKKDINNAKERYKKFQVMEINKTTWINRWREIDPNKTFTLPYIKSKINLVNITNNNFLTKFNEIFYDFINNYDKRKVIHYKPYFIMKYQIVNIYDFEEFIICQITSVVSRNDSQLAFEFLLSSYFKKGETKIVKSNVQYIGNYSLDNVVFTPGLDKNNDINYNLNELYKNDQSFTRKERKDLLNKINERNEINKNILTNTYTCFGYNKLDKNPSQSPIFAVNKDDCENSYDIIGYKKPYGVWDIPCKEDSECIFYKSNKNYENSYGRCVNNKCELPLNMKNLGYHFYINEKQTKPLCYNCKSKSWLPKTELGFCCDEQKKDIESDHKKYPFLNSPDYAFSNDDQNRFNAFLKKNCKLYSSFDNIFDKTPSNYKVVCDGHLDFFIPA
jgi:hypothetical protein